MNLKPKVNATYSNGPTAFRDFKNVEWKVGNAVLDASKLQDGQVIEPFTAIYENPDTGLYELVEAPGEDGEGGTAATMQSALLTGSQAVVVEGTDVNPMVAGIRKAAMIEARCHGVSDNFKAATQGRLTFDV